ncbi:hypothetical protein BC835DRAFT_986528 [Cytidiella melzeri]|nr:hypothetical protein BC835DRAFT_986528 [Cytidiella melzeri]
MRKSLASWLHLQAHSCQSYDTTCTVQRGEKLSDFASSLHSIPRHPDLQLLCSEPPDLRVVGLLRGGSCLSAMMVGQRANLSPCEPRSTMRYTSSTTPHSTTSSPIARRAHCLQADFFVSAACDLWDMCRSVTLLPDFEATLGRNKVATVWWRRHPNQLHDYFALNYCIYCLYETCVAQG